MWELLAQPPAFFTKVGQYEKKTTNKYHTRKLTPLQTTNTNSFIFLLSISDVPCDFKATLSATLIGVSMIFTVLVVLPVVLCTSLKKQDEKSARNIQAVKYFGQIFMLLATVYGTVGLLKSKTCKTRAHATKITALGM